MTNKEKKKIAAQIMQLEIAHEATADKDKKNQIENEIMKIAAKIATIDPDAMFEIDEIISKKIKSCSKKSRKN